MKNGEAEWPNDGSLGCDQSHGKVTVLCLQRASSGFNLLGNCSVRPWFALTRATFLTIHREGFPSGLKETLSLSHWVWICSDSFENSPFAVQTPLNDFVCCVFCLFAVALCSETAGEMPLEFVLPRRAVPSVPGKLLLAAWFFEPLSWKSSLF